MAEHALAPPVNCDAVVEDVRVGNMGYVSLGGQEFCPNVIRSPPKLVGVTTWLVRQMRRASGRCHAQPVGEVIICVRDFSYAPGRLTS